jgi:hypothetical protein
VTALTEKTETFFGTCKLPLSDRGIVLRYALRIYQDYVGKTPTSKHADGKFGSGSI